MPLPTATLSKKDVAQQCIYVTYPSAIAKQLGNFRTNFYAIPTRKYGAAEDAITAAADEGTINIVDAARLYDR
jgi:hypothetical protein